MVILRIGVLGVLLLMGVLTGFFFAFSFIVMPGFDLIAPVVAIEAMQGINVAVRNAMFFVPFFLTPVFGISCTVLAWMLAQKKVALMILGASGLYVLGGFLLTMLYHVPMNEALGVLDARALGEEAAAVWQNYTTDWTPWNTFRTAVCLIAMVPLAMAYGAIPRQTATG